MAAPLLGLVRSVSGWGWLVLPDLPDPFSLASAPYLVPGKVGLADYAVFLAITSSISALLAVLAMFLLRRVCTREAVRRPRRSFFAGRRGVLAAAEFGVAMVDAFTGRQSGGLAGMAAQRAVGAG